MITHEMIARINELARKGRCEGLTDSEKAEQAKLRQLYIDHMKDQVKASLDAAKISAHPRTCDCGCHAKH